MFIVHISDNKRKENRFLLILSTESNFTITPPCLVVFPPGVIGGVGHLQPAVVRQVLRQGQVPVHGHV